MAFDIDTGPATAPFNPVSLIPTWFVDLYPADTAPDKLIHSYGQHILGSIQKPVKTETARQHLLGSWRFLPHVAAVSPALFDEILLEFTERAFAFS